MSKHGVLADIWRKRILEKVAVTFASGFLGTLVETEGNITKAAVIAALGGGVSAVYGYAVRNRGTEANRPDLT